MREPNRAVCVVLIVALTAGLVVAAHAAQKLVAGQLAGGGGGGAGGGLKLVGSIPACPAGVSSGGGFGLTGGFTGAAQVWADSSSTADEVAATSSGMVTGLAAVAAGTGAQITFSLSAPATVEVHVRNIAGRLVRTVTPGQDCAAGLSTLVWNCQIYLVEVCARSASGSQSRALATVSLR
jgi:hypothetical protein